MLKNMVFIFTSLAQYTKQKLKLFRALKTKLGENLITKYLHALPSHKR